MPKFCSIGSMEVGETQPWAFTKRYGKNAYYEVIIHDHI